MSEHVFKSTPEHPYCTTCGYLGWTLEEWGRITHKESCPKRTDPWSQSYPKRESDKAV